MASSSELPVIAGTLQTDPRSGGIKRTSGVNVLPIVSETWSEVRDEENPGVDWLIAGYDGLSKNDITILAKGNGGLEACTRALPRALPVFGGCRLVETGRFVSFFHADDDTPTMKRARASMHKNGVLNVLEGCDREIELHPSDVSGDKGTAASYPTSTVADAGTQQTSTVQSQATDSESFSCNQPLHGDLPPPGVDPLHREQALSDAEFESVFGMEKPSFAKLPEWKRTIAKKAHGFF